MRLSPARIVSLSFLASVGAFSACGGDPVPKSELNTGGTSSGGTSAGGTSAGGNGGTSAGGSSAGGNGGSGAIITIMDGGGDSTILDGGCAGDDFKGDRLPANMLFVIDRSGSMNCNLPEHGQSTANCESFPQKQDITQPSKWELTRTAIKNAIDLLQTNSPDTSAGVQMFPIAGSQCGVDNTPDVAVGLLDAAQNSGIDAFLDTVSPEGKTPVAGATILGYDYLFNQLGSSGNRFLVLLTDGAETCKASELPKLLMQNVPDAMSVNIRTFVIGVPGSEDARALLSQIAWAGGTARDPSCVHDPAPANTGDCHFDMTQTTDFAADLAAALDKISGSVLTCEFDIPKGNGTEVDLNNVNVRVNGTVIPKDVTAGCDAGAEGWQYAAGNTKIVLCGAPCDDAVQPNANVSIVLGCPSVVK